MNRSLIFSLNVLTMLMVATPSFAQRREGSSKGIPAVGTQLPSVKAFDAFGNHFSTSSLRGNYSVLVFGCLT